ncbi:hypothetical protein ACX40Y_05700 [Sphingomonas sp. RS6]
MQLQYWAGAVIALIVAVASALGERRRRGRHDLDRIGLMPWMTMQMIALFAALVLASVALNAR